MNQKKKQNKNLDIPKIYLSNHFPETRSVSWIDLSASYMDTLTQFGLTTHVIGLQLPCSDYISYLLTMHWPW